MRNITYIVIAFLAGVVVSVWSLYSQIGKVSVSQPITLLPQVAVKTVYTDTKTIAEDYMSDYSKRFVFIGGVSNKYSYYDYDKNMTLDLEILANGYVSADEYPASVRQYDVTVDEGVRAGAILEEYLTKKGVNLGTLTPCAILDYPEYYAFHETRIVYVTFLERCDVAELPKWRGWVDLSSGKVVAVGNKTIEVNP